MNKSVVVSVLVDNLAQGRGLMAEHGLAFHVRRGSESLLFDTGQSGLVVDNARRMDVDLTTLGAIALSHGHYDHTGGLPAVRQAAPAAPLFAHPGVARRRYARNPDGSTREVGPPEAARAALEPDPKLWQPSKTPVEVLSGFFLTGEIPRETGFEDTGGAFFLDEEARLADPIEDDQALFFDSRDGVVVLLGCAHAGVINTIRHISRLTGGSPLHAVLGGLHLVNATPERLGRTIEALRAFAPRVLGPAHCTGLAAQSRLWSRFPGEIAACAVGSRFVFQP